jgi:hypothetical protein
MSQFKISTVAYIMFQIAELLCVVLRAVTAVNKLDFRLCVISGFHHEVDEKCALLGYYAASSGNPLPTFRDDISVPFIRANNPNFLTSQMGPMGCHDTSAKNYH